MDIKDYISSGILESYVLGAVTPQEQQEVECMSHIYPEIQEELRRLQGSIESYADFVAQQPSAQLKKRVLDAIENVQQVPGTNSSDSSSDPKVVPINRSPQSRGWSLAVAACIVGLIALGISLYLKNEQAIQLAQEVEKAELEKNGLRLEKEVLDIDLEQTKEQLALETEIKENLASGATERILLAGTDNSPESRVNIFWNKSNSKVLMQVENLPTPEETKQYQLWAIVDGTPQDMGVFDFDPSSNDIKLIPVAIPNAQAFAITLEERGGSAVPNLNALYVIGNTSA